MYPHGEANADPLDDQRGFAHFTAGESHFAAEQWTDAAREFALAYEFSARPEMLINLSRAHERAAQPAAALADLELLLTRHPETPYRAEAQLRMTKLREALAAARADRALAAPAGESAAWPLPDTSPPRDVAARAVPAVRERASSPAIWPPRWPTLALAGTAVAAAVVAFATGLPAHRKLNHLETSCPGDRCDPQSDFEQQQSRGRALARASTALTFVSVALAGTAGALWYYDLRPRREPVAFAIDLDGKSVAARVRAQF